METIRKRYVDVLAQLDSLARIDSSQIGSGLIWRGSNWVKESHYGLDHETIEQNELTVYEPNGVSESESELHLYL